MPESSKPFNELTYEEAVVIVKEIMKTSKSVDEIRERLTDAGFNGDAALIRQRGSTPFTATVTVDAPPSGKTVGA